MDNAHIDNVGLKVIKEIAHERQAQDRQWGGAGTDDNRLAGDWYRYIDHQMMRSNDDVRAYALTRIKAGEFRDPTPEEVLAMDVIARARFVKIAALAVAAIESIDRRGGAHAAQS